MRILPTSVLAATLMLAALPVVAPRVEAKTGVLRCQMADGTHAYTNQACDALGAKAMPLSGQLVNRIEHEQEREAGLHGVALPTATELPLQAGARRSVQGGCAHDPRQLATDLTASMAMHDVNRVAESFDWAGMSDSRAQRVMLRLERLSRQVVTGTEYFDATIGGYPLLADSGGSAGSAGQMRVTLADGNSSSVVDFNVRLHQGCYFLQY